MTEEITRIEQQIFEMTRELNQLRSQSDGEEVRNYSFETLNGPGDLYCPMWNLLGMAGIDVSNWTPQFKYWVRPAEMDDGGENLND